MDKVRKDINKLLRNLTSPDKSRDRDKEHEELMDFKFDPPLQVFILEVTKVVQGDVRTDTPEVELIVAMRDVTCLKDVKELNKQMVTKPTDLRVGDIQELGVLGLWQQVSLSLVRRVKAHQQICRFCDNKR